jgi:flagellar protein FlbD
MVRLTRFNGKEYFLNAELIEKVESTPDTVITLVDGKIVLVKESVKLVIKRIISYHRKVHGLNRKIREKVQQS